MPTAIGELIIKAAEAEIGCKENPPGSNRGPCVEKYQAHDWINGGGYPWCVSGAWGWVVWHKVLKQPNPYPTASVAQLEKWARDNGWAVQGPPKRGDLCCLNHGQHVTIFHHAVSGGRFAGLGFNQSDAVQISEYPLRSITTLVRVPDRFEPPRPPRRRPRYEVVRGLGEREQVVYVSASPKRIANRVERMIRQKRRNIRVRRVPRKQAGQ